MAYNSNFENFIPEIWSRELAINFDKYCVMRNLVNTKYEGEIKQFGDTVKIPGTGTVTVKTYTKGMTLVPDDLTPTSDTLTIDKSYYFTFEVDDLDAAQSNIDVVSAHTDRAGVALRNQIDTLLLGTYVDAHTSVGTDTAPIDLSDTNVSVYKKIVDVGVYMDEHDIPGERWLVVPPRVAGVIQKDSYFVDASKSGDGGNLLRTGLIGNIAGFNIYKSSNLIAVDPPTSALGADIFPCLAGTKDAISFAMQVTRMESARPPLTFTTIVKGLVCFGYHVVYPTALAVLKINATTI